MSKTWTKHKDQHPLTGRQVVTPSGRPAVVVDWFDRKGESIRDSEAKLAHQYRKRRGKMGADAPPYNEEVVIVRFLDSLGGFLILHDSELEDA